MAPRQSGHIDNRRTKKTYGSYINLGQDAQTINNINQHRINPLEELEKYCSPTATFDSDARFDAPRCAESTRLRSVSIIEKWIHTDEDGPMSASLFWLSGGAGAGKSALAQSLSEKLEEKNQLAASFFFSKRHTTSGAHLIPTLVVQLIDTFQGIVPFVEDKILQRKRGTSIFTKTYHIQSRELLVEPLLALKSDGSLVTYPRLVVIDGLDECHNPDVQCELLRVIADAIRRIPYPLRFLVTSRPEAHITRLFDYDSDFRAIPVRRYNLSEDPDADTDIRSFLEKEFAEIRRVHHVGQLLPKDWPGPNVITSLVKRSSGHFIYPSTLVKYLGSPSHRPEDRLEDILRPQPLQETDHQLYRLYEEIFDGVRKSHGRLEEIWHFLGILYFRSKQASGFVMHTKVEHFLETKAGDLHLLLDPIRSLVAVDDDKGVRILHETLFDYLLDSTFDLTRVHELVATFIFNEKIVKDVSFIYDFRDFAYHCRYAYLSDTLKNYLNSLEIPYPRYVMPASKTFPSWDEDLNIFLRKLLWDFCRTLSRKDLDSTGRLHKHYATKWITFLNSVVPKRTKSQSNVGVNVDVNRLKRKLDTVLRKWKPPNSNPRDMEMDQDRRVTLIEQEHSVFSAYAKASFCGATNAIVSSFVHGGHHIHSYNFGIWGNDSFLALRTYSTDGDPCYQDVFVGSPDIVPKTLDHLKNVEKYLLSNLYQKYGLEPDDDVFLNS